MVLITSCHGPSVSSMNQSRICICRFARTLFRSHIYLAVLIYAHSCHLEAALACGAEEALRARASQATWVREAAVLYKQGTHLLLSRGGLAFRLLQA